MRYAIVDNLVREWAGFGVTALPGCYLFLFLSGKKFGVDVVLLWRLLYRRPWQVEPYEREINRVFSPVGLKCSALAEEVPPAACEEGCLFQTRCEFDFDVLQTGARWWDIP